jgi:superfamily I DNA and/or RNA helicase
MSVRTTIVFSTTVVIIFLIALPIDTELVLVTANSLTGSLTMVATEVLKTLKVLIKDLIIVDVDALVEVKVLIKDLIILLVVTEL